MIGAINRLAVRVGGYWRLYHSSFKRRKLPAPCHWSAAAVIVASPVSNHIHISQP